MRFGEGSLPPNRSARKHGITDADIAHAITHHLYAGDIRDEDSPPWRVLYLGPDRAGNLLEVVVIERDDGTELAIHAMHMRSKYQPRCPGQNGNTMSERHRGTSGGVELTDAELDELADEAERGYEPDQLRPRPRRGRPPLGEAAASVVHVRLQPALRDALEQAADVEQTTSSEIVRRALHQYLESGSSSGTREAS